MTTYLLIRVPTGDALDPEAPPSGAWQRFFELKQAQFVEEFGNADLLPADVTALRSSYCAIRPSPRAEQRDFVVAEMPDDAPPGIAPPDDALPDEALPDVACIDVRFVDDSTAEDFDALDPARLVGTCGINLPLAANTTSADLHVWIDPACRGRGLGSAIIATARAALVADGRTRITAWTCTAPCDPADPDAARPLTGPGALDATRDATGFLLRRDFGLERVSKSFGLINLDDAARLAELTESSSALAAAIADAYRDDYELCHWQGPAPDDILAAVADMYNEFAIDIPHSADEDASTYTPEDVKAADARLAAAGQVVFTTAARHRATGTLAGYTSIYWREGTASATQEATWVRRSHRGRRLGLALKLENLRHVLQASAERGARGEPVVQQILTWNAEENSHMWSINEQLGYEVVGAEGEWRSFFYDDAWHANRQPAPTATN